MGLWIGDGADAIGGGQVVLKGRHDSLPIWTINLESGILLGGEGHQPSGHLAVCGASIISIIQAKQVRESKADL